MIVALTLVILALLGLVLKLAVWMMMATVYLFIVWPFRLIVGFMDRA